MRAKLQDVAALAGVSATTVSRVINQKGYLSQQTIDKVHAAMKELNYYPNSLARSLQGKSTKLVGLIFPNIDTIFYAELVKLPGANPLLPRGIRPSSVIASEMLTRKLST